MINVMKRFAKDESGATAIEYGLIAALIALAIVAGASTLGNAIGNQFEYVAEKLKNTQGTGADGSGG